MTASLWLAKRLSSWILLCFFVLLGLVLLVESVEQGRLLSEGRSVAALLEVLASRLPILMRDLIPPLMALSVALFVVRLRRRHLAGLEASGLSRRRLLVSLGLVCFFWSGFLLQGTEALLDLRQAQPGQQSWVMLDGVATRLRLDETGGLDVLQLKPGKGRTLSISSPRELDRDRLLGLLTAPMPAQASLSALVNHPHPNAPNWWAWRQLSRVTPGLLALLVAGFCLILPLGMGQASALALGLGLGTQMGGSVLVEAGFNPLFALGVLLGAAGVLLVLSHRGAQPSRRR
jgi:hypothetical protein